MKRSGPSLKIEGSPGLGLENDDPALRDLHRHLKLPDRVVDGRHLGEGPPPSVHEQVKLANAPAVELECESDGSRILTGAATPVGEPPIDLIAAPSAKWRQLSDPELRSERADWIECSGFGIPEHGRDCMRAA